MVQRILIFVDFVLLIMLSILNLAIVCVEVGCGYQAKVLKHNEDYVVMSFWSFQCFCLPSKQHFMHLVTFQIQVIVAF